MLGAYSTGFFCQSYKSKFIVYLIELWFWFVCAPLIVMLYGLNALFSYLPDAAASFAFDGCSPLPVPNFTR